MRLSQIPSRAGALLALSAALLAFSACGDDDEPASLECVGQHCELTCPAGQDCNARCRNGADCNLDCNGVECDLSCQARSRCLSDCHLGGGCNADCEGQSTCSVDCREAGNCDLDCAGGSTCDITCRGNCGGGCAGTWVNLYYKDPAEITGTIRGIAMIGGITMNIPPRTREILNYSCEVGGDARIFELFGHYHAHTERFSTWRVRDGQRELVYESFDWHEPSTLVYDSVNENPPPDRAKQQEGGWSGPLEVKAGDWFEWECEVNNTLDTLIRFANEALTAEMCILFGGYVADNPVPMRCVR